MTDRRRRPLSEVTRELTGRPNYFAERFDAEAEFAEAFAKLHPSRSRSWLKLIDQARRLVGESVSAGRGGRLGSAVRKAEALLAPIGKAAKTYTVHCVGHAHIDMNWMWSWPETVAVTNDTFITVLKLMDEFEQFCFTQSQASVYAIVARYNPELLERIKQRVAEGRWEVAAVHWVEGDKNLASGESLARHLLYTRRFIAQMFELAPEQVPLDWEPDTFGHAHTIPTIVSKGAVRRYYLCRGGDFEKPPVFWWQGPDGSRVLVNAETTWYNDHIGPDNAAAMLKFCRATGLKDWMCVYGVGDHGGGPTRRDILRAIDMNTWPIWPNFRFAAAGSYFDILEKHGRRWPVLDRELNFEFTGCYSSQSRIKKFNRMGENCCLEAETAAMLARRALGRDYPGEQLRQSWINTLFGHFHDILPGSCVQATREYQSGLFQRTAAATGMIKTHSYRALAAAADTSFAAGDDKCEAAAMGAGAGRLNAPASISAATHVARGNRALVIFNPTAWPREEVVTTTVWGDEEIGSKAFVVRGPDGQATAAQRIGAGKYWDHNYVDLAFPVAVGPAGYAACVVEENNSSRAERQGQGPVTVQGGFRGGEKQPAGAMGLENEYLAVGFDRATSGIVKLLDKTTGRDLADPADPLGVLEYVLERPGGMSAWIIGDVKRCVCPLEVENFEPVHAGPYVGSLAARLKVNDSTITVTYTLKAGQPQLEITLQADWVERGGPESGTPTLRMKFPFALVGATGRYEIPFGSIARESNAGREVPALRWADVAGRPAAARGRAGCTLLNDCKYGYSLDGSTLRVTLLRSSYSPDPLPEMGSHTMRLALVPHGGNLATAKLVRLGAGFNHPLVPVPTDVHKGLLPADSGPVVSAAPANVVVSSVKKCEDDDAIICRLFEADGKAADARVALSKALLGRIADAAEVDLLERPIDPSTAKATKTGFTVRIAANGIASVKVAFKDR